MATEPTDEEEQKLVKKKTQLISKELLSQEEILNLGISEDDVQSYRMKKFKEAFTLDKWIHINELRALTFETRIVPVTVNEAHSFIAYSRYIHSQRAKSQDIYCKTILNYEQNKHKIDGDIESLKDKISTQIDDAKWNECGFFAKFNSRSPKDVHEYEGNKDYVMDMFFAEMDKFKAKSHDGTVQLNEALISSYIARAKLLKMKTAQDVIRTFAASFRALEDLTGTLRLGDEHMDISIALRKWNESVPTNGHGEFRCFVHNKELNAITQYISCIWFKGLETQKNVIKDRIIKFYETKVKDYVPMDSFVIDFLVLGIELDEEHNIGKQDNVNDIFVIELNPFYKSAGAGLFEWRLDRELFLNGPCEIRVRNELDPKLVDIFHPSWAKSYEKYTGISIHDQDAKSKQNDGDLQSKNRCVVL
eukprot:26625_1